ncbi:siderophore ABC transporter substrate-binding protein [Paraglaciecola sp. 2405UD69-4]|uniref:siderophore ABC transporter substrate-binding protein n=1 Tax=Paraglaciecola sp. 2405UD69-4 TaxID=3391836 RepID=UPI0039C90E83
MKKLFVLILTSLTLLQVSWLQAATTDSVPQKVVSFDLAQIDTLDYLGVQVLGVPKSHTINYLAKFQGDEYINVGSMFEPDFETVASLEPDLIIVGGRTQSKIKMMKSIAPTLDSTVWGDNYLQQFYLITQESGALVNQPELAAQAIADIKQQVAKIKAKAKQGGKVMFVMTTGGKITVFGPGSRFGWLYTELGFEAAGDENALSHHGDPVSFEYLRKLNPDILLVLDRDIAIGKDTGMAKQLLENDLIKGLKAYQNNKVIMLDGYAWYTVGTGISAMNKILAQIQSALIE